MRETVAFLTYMQHEIVHLMRALPSQVAWVRCRPGYLCKFVIVFRLFPGASLFLSPQKPIKHLQYSNSNRTEDPPETKVVAFFLNIVIYLVNNAITPSIVNRTQSNCISIELSRTKSNSVHQIPSIVVGNRIKSNSLKNINWTI